jgi:meso-butanediol dehydrogenase / (S,S)-butanediol dehydrogenase / diacetyl reductase
VSRRFDDKVALITGAASGIGRAVTVRLAEEGAQVFAVDVNAEGLGQTKAMGAGSVITRQVDLCEPGGCADVVTACIGELGALHVLGNVAGIYISGHAPDTTLDEYRRIMAVNLDAPFFLAQAALPHLLASAGNIVNIASNSAIQGVPYSVAYAMSKGGVVQMTRALAVEYIKTSLRVNAIAPAGVNTNIAANVSLPAWTLISPSGWRATAGWPSRQTSPQCSPSSPPTKRRR